MLERDVRTALATGQFEIQWQPIVDCLSGALSGFEALLRWDRPGHGPVSPSVFVPVAESLGLFRDLDGWVLQTACTAAVGWPQPMRVAVNVSAAWFQTTELSHLVETTLRHTGLDPSRLELEVTERVFLETGSTAKSELGHLKALGVGLSLDDFGTGYSALGYLRDMAFDKLKLDRVFIEGLGSCRRTEVIVRSLLQLGRGLGMVVCAEGVEEEGQLGILQAYECQEAQGFLIGRPGRLTQDSFKPVFGTETPGLFMADMLPQALRAWAS